MWRELCGSLRCRSFKPRRNCGQWYILPRADHFGSMNAPENGPRPADEKGDPEASMVSPANNLHRRVPSLSERSRLSIALIVLVVWGMMVIAELVFVWEYGSNVPSWDGWDMVPTLTGAQPVTWSWLWSQHNEHRVPLPRLILLGLNKVTILDFRGGMYLEVCIMATLAAAMIVVARRLRGTTSYTDLFFPLILLDWGKLKISYGTGKFNSLPRKRSRVLFSWSSSRP